MRANDQADSKDTEVHAVGSSVDPAWAWAPYEPDERRPWELRLAGHLYRRAGFGATWPELQQALADGPQRTVDKLVRPDGDLAVLVAEFDDYENAAAGSGPPAPALSAWWLRRMIETPFPLQERMTLFWHGHFGINGARVKSGRLMATHVQTLRRHCLGNYGELLDAMLQDPAVFLGLDAAENRKARMSEHLARQVLDGYGVGPGNYDDVDVRETARALTGWTVLRNQLRYFEREQDEGDKRILGQQGNWNYQDVVRIVTGQRATSSLLIGKLYRWLISETEQPGAELLEPLVDSFAADLDVGRVVETILRSNLFYSPMAYRQRVKSPVDFAIGLIRPLEANLPTLQLGDDVAKLGQNLYHPPTVKGWAGGRHWINSATMVGRANLAVALFAEKGPYAGKLDLAAVARRHGHGNPQAAAEFLLALLLQDDVAASVRDNLLGGLLSGDDPPPAIRLREFAHLLVTRPEFQVG